MQRNPKLLIIVKFQFPAISDTKFAHLHSRYEMKNVCQVSLDKRLHIGKRTLDLIHL